MCFKAILIVHLANLRPVYMKVGGGGGDPRLARYRAAGQPTYHVNVRDQMKMRDYMDRGVSPLK